MTQNSVVRFLQGKRVPMNIIDISRQMSEDSYYGRMGVSDVAIAAALWLGEVEGVIERAGLDASGCMTWRAK